MRRLGFGFVVAFAPAVAAAAPCVDRASALRDQAVSDAQVALCFDQPASCWTFDVAAKAWTPANPDASKHVWNAAQPAPAPASIAPARLTANIKTCAKAGKDCRAIDLPDAAAADSTTVVATADRSLVALYGARGALSLFDGKSEKLIAQIKPWKTTMADSIESAQFLGQTLLVRENDSPVSSAARLFDRRGTKLADAGPGVGLTDEVIAVSADEWAFTTLATNRVYVDNVKTGKHVAMIAAVAGKSPNQLAGVAIVHRTADAKTLVIASGDPASGVVLYDIATRTSKRFTPPVCK
jgi:hypothetical protein